MDSLNCLEGLLKFFDSERWEQSYLKIVSKVHSSEVLSAGGAEIVAEALMGDVQAQVISLKEAGITDEQVTKQMMNRVRFNSEFSKLASATIAAVATEDVTTALFTASNAVENNMLAHIGPTIEQHLIDSGDADDYLAAVQRDAYNPVRSAQEMTEDEFVKDALSRKYLARDPTSDELQRDQQRYAHRYHTLRLYDSSREMVLGTGHQRWER